MAAQLQKWSLLRAKVPRGQVFSRLMEGCRSAAGQVPCMSKPSKLLPTVRLARTKQLWGWQLRHWGKKLSKWGFATAQAASNAYDSKLLELPGQGQMAHDAVELCINKRKSLPQC